MKKYDIVIYSQSDGLPAHIVESIEKAAAWVGCTVQALYKSMHLTGKMQAKGYEVERVKYESSF